MPKINFTTPVGRLVMGSLYEPQTKDADGKPLVVKNGPNAGQPTQKYFFAVAFPKAPGETHWAYTAWGALIWKVGHDAFNNVADSPSFAWKVVDGDSQIPNKKGNKPCDREGYPGHWVVSFNSGFPPKIYNANGTEVIPEVDAVKLGYFVQVNADVDGNMSQQNPGVFINHKMVALSAYGPEIYVGPDASTAGFGEAPLPVGASLTPPAAMTTPPAGAAPAPGQPYPAATVPLPASAPPPNPAILQMPGVPPAMPPPPPAAPVRQMTPKAGGVAYEAFVAQGWTDDMLRQQGYMI